MNAIMGIEINTNTNTIVNSTVLLEKKLAPIEGALTREENYYIKQLKKQGIEVEYVTTNNKTKTSEENRSQSIYNNDTKKDQEHIEKIHTNRTRQEDIRTTE